MKLRKATETDRCAVRDAIGHLKIARNLLKEAGARNTVARVRLALTSAHGAMRHVERCQFAAEHKIEMLTAEQVAAKFPDALKVVSDGEGHQHLIVRGVR